MTWAGVNWLSVLAAIMVGAAVVNVFVGVIKESWWLVALAGVLAVCGLAMAVLALIPGLSEAG